MRALGAVLWRYLVGSLFTLTPVTAVLVVGWTQRATANAVARRLGESEQRAWPRWIMDDNAGALLAEARGANLSRRVALLFRALFGSLWLNASAGIRALIPVAIVILPAGLLFLFSWWAGWENSFNKGYEQSWVGPFVASAGIVYFMTVMTLLPLAETRHAVHNSWRAFFDISFLRAAAREVRFGLIGLALAFVAAGLIVAGLKAAPLAIGNAAETPEKALQFAQAYPLIIAAILFPLYVSLRLFAARVYARAAARIAAREDPPPQRAAFTRLALGSGSLVMATIASVVTFAAWFGFVSQIYIAQFLVHDWTHWINHPLVQLPWVGSIFGR